MSLMRDLAEAGADRAMESPMECGRYDHQWIAYGQRLWIVEPTTGVQTQMAAVMLYVCSRCCKTPEEVTRP